MKITLEIVSPSLIRAEVDGRRLEMYPRIKDGRASWQIRGLRSGEAEHTLGGIVAQKLCEDLADVAAALDYDDLLGYVPGETEQPADRGGTWELLEPVEASRLRLELLS
ncbi:hypothetical protein ASA1KI_39630 [Opitutales bacterium ASA1]|uniref:hypothetical protein n=1 Tax=Congregicoccus parvus TaxID=3081749 RepID=UPI002B2F83AD|nr:hypothetical protein ASA1KI_39630 [Opitutales bacterium ASA1]